MKTAIIIHGMPDKEEYYNVQRPASSNCHWLPWIQKQLLLKDILAQTPEMPVPYNPEYSAWEKVFEQFPLNEETILIGHSCGGGFIARYLSEHDIKVGRVVLVAPWIDLEKKLKTGMFDFELDSSIVFKTNGITIFSSTNDMQSVQESVKLLKEKIVDIQVVEFENKGHFCLKHMGTDAFPELLSTVFS
jgi:uncharacterized protein